MRIRVHQDLRVIEPTSEQLRERFVGVLDNGTQYMALWYPQMGGYVAKCWIVAGCWSGPHPKDGKHAGPPGFDAFVFHDGEFPFGDSRRLAVEIHHCNAEQFIKFGEAALAFLRPQVEIRDE